MLIITQKGIFLDFKAIYTLLCNLPYSFKKHVTDGDTFDKTQLSQFCLNRRELFQMQGRLSDLQSVVSLFQGHS